MLDAGHSFGFVQKQFKPSINNNITIYFYLSNDEKIAQV